MSAQGGPYRQPGERSEGPKVGGTRGGIGEFLIGLGMLIAGGYLFLDNIVVSGDFWSRFGGRESAFGLVLLPLFVGIGMLFFNGKSVIGWLLTGGATIALVVGVTVRMTMHWRQTSLFNTVMIFVLIAGGIGLIARSLRSHA